MSRTDKEGLATEEGRSPLRGSGSRPTDEAAISVASSPKASIPSAVRRTICSFETAPRDGTPFHILNTVRFNPVMERFEALCFHEDEPERRVWRAANFDPAPSVWLRRVPLPYEIPDDQWFPCAFTATYLVCRKSLLARLIDRLLRRGPKRLKWTYKLAQGEWVAASAMSAGTAETAQQAQGRSPASAVGEAETPGTSGDTPHG